MSSKTNISIVILWEDEIRKAAALLAASRAEEDDAKSWEIAREAYAACEVALCGVTGEKAVVMLANRELHDSVKARRARSTEGKTGEL